MVRSGFDDDCASRASVRIIVRKYNIFTRRNARILRQHVTRDVVISERPLGTVRSRSPEGKYCMRSMKKYQGKMVQRDCCVLRGNAAPSNVCQVARKAQPSISRPLAAIQLPATRTAIRAHSARSVTTNALAIAITTNTAE